MRYSAIPLAFLGLFGAFVLIYRSAGLPTGEELVSLARSAFEVHGPLVVFVAAVAEGLLVVNWYLPGSFVIVVGVALSSGDGLRAVVYVALVVAAFLLTAVINYWLGRTAWYRFLLFVGLRKPLERIQPKAAEKGTLLIYYTYCHPNIGALASVSFGIMRMPFGPFVLHVAISLCLWNTLWGLMAYHLGSSVLRLLDVRYILPVAALWVLISIARGIYNARRSKGDHNPE